MLALRQVSKVCRHWLLGVHLFTGLVVRLNRSIVMMKEKQEHIISHCTHKGFYIPK